mgnify:CR=1 FL=1
MNAQNFTQKTIETIQTAQSMAQENQNQYITPEHILYALVDQDGGLIPSLLGKMGVDCNTVLAELDTAIAALPKVTGDTDVYLSREADRVMQAAEKSAKSLGDEYLSAVVVGVVSADFGSAGSGEQTNISVLSEKSLKFVYKIYVPVILLFNIFLGDIGFFKPFIERCRENFFFKGFGSCHFHFSSFPAEKVSAVFLFLLLTTISINLLTASMETPEMVKIITIGSINASENGL